MYKFNGFCLLKQQIWFDVLYRSMNASEYVCCLNCDHTFFAFLSELCRNGLCYNCFLKGQIFAMLSPESSYSDIRRYYFFVRVVDGSSGKAAVVPVNFLAHF